MRSRLRGVSRRLTLPALLSLVWMIALVPAAPAQELALDVGEVETSSDAGPVKVLVELADPPAAVVYGEVLRSSPLASQRATAEAVAAAQAQIRKIEAEQARFEGALASLPETPQEIFRVSKALNGFALQVAPGSLRDLSQLPGIKRIHFLIDEYPTNSTSVPFLGTPNLWSDTLGLGLNADGTGIRIGIIDTGIDYQHADFGGNGVLADYQANNRTVAPDVYFPTAKVDAGASQMDHFRDPTLATAQVVAAPGSLANLLIPRHWLTEESGYVTFSQSGNLKLRVPVYVAPRADSLISAADTITTGGAGSGSTTIALSGTDVCTGTLGAGPTCTGTFPNDEVSLVSPFELQVASPSNPVAAPPYADLQYAGVAADAPGSGSAFRRGETGPRPRIRRSTSTSTTTWTGSTTASSSTRPPAPWGASSSGRQASPTSTPSLPRSSRRRTSSPTPSRRRPRTSSTG